MLAHAHAPTAPCRGFVSARLACLVSFATCPGSPWSPPRTRHDASVTSTLLALSCRRLAPPCARVTRLPAPLDPGGARARPVLSPLRRAECRAPQCLVRATRCVAQRSARAPALPPSAPWLTCPACRLRYLPRPLESSSPASAPRPIMFLRKSASMPPHLLPAPPQDHASSLRLQRLPPSPLPLLAAIRAPRAPLDPPSLPSSPISAA